MSESHEDRMKEFLAGDNWFEDERLVALYDEVATGVEGNVPDPLATEYIGVLMMVAQVQRQAILSLAKELDELSKDQ